MSYLVPEHVQDQPDKIIVNMGWVVFLVRAWRLLVSFAAILAAGAIGQATAMWLGFTVLFAILIGGIMFENRVIRRKLR
ncbi:hypothetical protein [Nocardia sp. NPDC004711]